MLKYMQHITLDIIILLPTDSKGDGILCICSLIHGLALQSTGFLETGILAQYCYTLPDNTTQFLCINIHTSL